MFCCGSLLQGSCQLENSCKSHQGQCFIRIREFSRSAEMWRGWETGVPFLGRKRKAASWSTSISPAVRLSSRAAQTARELASGRPARPMVPTTRETLSGPRANIAEARRRARPFAESLVVFATRDDTRRGGASVPSAPHGLAGSGRAFPSRPTGLRARAFSLRPSGWREACVPAASGLIGSASTRPTSLRSRRLFSTSMRAFASLAVEALLAVFVFLPFSSPAALRLPRARPPIR